jgi:hypothetical protein
MELKKTGDADTDVPSNTGFSHAGKRKAIYEPNKKNHL